MANIEERKYISWSKKFNKYVSEVINDLQNEFLNKIGLSIKIDQSYQFIGGKSRWLAAYQKSSRMIKNNIILISINYKRIYDEMRKRDIETDSFNIEAQARITISHEVGHGIMDYLVTNKIIKNISHKKEEEIVEEFGEYMFQEATYVYDSKLVDFINKLF